MTNDIQKIGHFSEAKTDGEWYQISGLPGFDHFLRWNQMDQVWEYVVLDANDKAVYKNIAITN